MVNVNIHQFNPTGTVVDAAALAQFQKQWATYRKLIEGNCLAHHEVRAILRQTLSDLFKSPFCFLDIACGDASMMKTALTGTKVRHYHCIDLWQPALDLAAAQAQAVNRPLSVISNDCNRLISDKSLTGQKQSVCDKHFWTVL
jgi:hypothetical protein